MTDFTIYPNPNNGTFNLQYTEEQNASISTFMIDTKVQLFTLKKFHKGENKINTIKFKSGIILS
jgi:hypothetical protein